MKRTIFILLSTLFCSLQAGDWANSTLKEMTTQEKIGQLFMIAGYVDAEYAARESENLHLMEMMDSYIKEYAIGGIGLVGPSESAKQVALLNHFQSLAKYPLLIAQDFEWGLSMRLSDGMRFPKNSTLGAISDNNLIYEMGREIGRQGRLVGVHMNLSPDIDVNIEPENPVINVRSFGSSPLIVAEKGIAMTRGLQDAGMIASAKHFPGLGDITTDPHLGLPVNLHERKRLEEVELYPFRELVKAGVLSIQTDHVLMPALEADPKLPSSLSPAIVQGILKEKMGFQGLVLSGALRMKALRDNFSQEEIVLKAFLAGSDMLLMPHDVSRAVEGLKNALAMGKISLKEIDERVLKILELKEKYVKSQRLPLPLPSHSELHTREAEKLKRRLYESAVSLHRDKNRLLSLHSRKLAYLQIGESPSNAFYEALQKELSIAPATLDNLDQESTFIVAVYPADPRRISQIRLLEASEQQEALKHFRVHGITQTTLEALKALEKVQERCIVCYFGNPFGLHYFDAFSTFLMAFEDDPVAQESAAALLCRSF